ncbi:MAG: phage tail protein, partial [Sphingomonas bacterium]|nr:phage tail protein [Sphingomonas bacterium]
LPRKIKDLMLFNAGSAYLGEVASLTPPKLTRKMEEWRGGGMDTPIEIDMGGEKLEAEWSIGGPVRDVLRQSGFAQAGMTGLRFVGTFQADDTGELTRIEIVLRGRHSEIDMGEWKPGEGGEFKVKTSVSYYKLIWNGRTEIEIDVLGMVHIVGGVDLMAERRAALGLF